MAFTQIANSTTNDATEVLNNFYHIGQGDRLPMGGNGLNNTTGVYDLGSSTYKFRDGYFSGSISCARVSNVSSIGGTGTTVNIRGGCSPADSYAKAGTTTAYGDIFSWITPYIPNNNDEILVTGAINAFYSNLHHLHVPSLCRRYNSTSVVFETIMAVPSTGAFSFQYLYCTSGANSITADVALAI